MSLQHQRYGRLPSGESVGQYTLANAQGTQLKVITYGGIITELHVPDREGRTADVVLGLPGLEAYLAGHPWFGAITGRVAGRISLGCFSLEGQSHSLEVNSPPNHLHGGSDALDKKNWIVERDDSIGADPRVTMSYVSPDGEGGYPGNVSIKVTYTLTRDNAVRIDYQATTDKPTPLSLTNHSYFNLSGEGQGTVENHFLLIHADTFVPTDDELTLSGKIEAVAGKPNDFTSSKRLGDAIPNLHINHGDVYLIRREGTESLVPVARVEDPRSGRVMEVESNDRCVQFYTGRFLDSPLLVGKSGVTYPRYGGLCLECQGYSDGVNAPEIDDIVLRPDELYRRTSIYRFSTA